MSRSRPADEGPVSLFSFQDIITSITGIMILVVMLLVLEVITRESLKSPSPRPQASTIPDLQHKIATLEAEKNQLSDSITRQENIIAKLIPSDSQQMNRDIKREENKSLALNQKINELTAKLAQLKKVMGSTLTDTAPDQQELQQLSKQLARIQAENRVTFEFTPSHKTPILVQCSRTGIQAMSLREKSAAQTFVSGSRSDLTDSIAKFEKWAVSLDKTKNAFVVLVKPSAATYATEVIDVLRKNNFDVGYEPLEENRTAFFSDRQES